LVGCRNTCMLYLRETYFLDVVQTYEAPTWLFVTCEMPVYTYMYLYWRLASHKWSRSTCFRTYNKGVFFVLFVFFCVHATCVLDCSYLFTGTPMKHKRILLLKVFNQDSQEHCHQQHSSEKRALQDAILQMAMVYAQPNNACVSVLYQTCEQSLCNLGHWTASV